MLPHLRVDDFDRSLQVAVDLLGTLRGRVVDVKGTQRQTKRFQRLSIPVTSLPSADRH